MAYTIAKMIDDDIITREEIEDCEKLVNFTDDALLFKLKNVSSRAEYKHLYEALYLRKKYKKIILQQLWGRFRAPLQIVISLLIWTYSMEELLNIFDHFTKK